MFVKFTTGIAACPNSISAICASGAASETYFTRLVSDARMSRINSLAPPAVSFFDIIPTAPDCFVVSARIWM